MFSVLNAASVIFLKRALTFFEKKLRGSQFFLVKNWRQKIEFFGGKLFFAFIGFHTFFRETARVSRRRAATKLTQKMGSELFSDQAHPKKLDHGTEGGSSGLPRKAEKKSETNVQVKE